MHVRTKFDGGKQINRSQSGSWTGRCVGAALRMNDGPGWGPTCWEKVTGLPPSETFKAVAEERCKKTTSDRKRKATENEKIKRKRRKRGDNSLQSRLDYSRYDGNGPNAIDILPDIPASDLHDVMLFYYSRQIKVTEAAAADITLRTNEQGGNSNSKAIWHEHRRIRVTASNVGKIAKRRPTTKVKSVVQQLIAPKFHGNEATRWGTVQEDACNEQYLLQKKAMSPNITTTKSGLVISVENPWLAASPDGLVHDPSTDPPDGIVEYKNPYVARNMTLTEAMTKVKNFCLVYNKENQLELKKNHDFYYQVQCIMFCTKRSWCDFVVMTKTLHIQRIDYDPGFWSAVLAKLKAFYFTTILPQLASPRPVV